VKIVGSCQRQKPQATTPQAPICYRQRTKVANAKVRNRYTNLTYIMIGLPIIWRLQTLAFVTFLLIGGYGLALAVFGAIKCIPKIVHSWEAKLFFVRINPSCYFFPF